MDAKITAKIVSVKGHCYAGHMEGDTMDISCHNPGGLCGFCYHNIFPNLLVFQNGGNLPWLTGDTIFQECPDPHNRVVVELTREVSK